MRTPLSAVRAKAAYLDGELCGVDDKGLPNFAATQAATDGERGARLVFYAFDILHLDGATRRACRFLSARHCCSPSWQIFQAFSSTVMNSATAN
jgi:ATP-dependent DNA ligase